MELLRGRSRHQDAQDQRAGRLALASVAVLVRPGPARRSGDNLRFRMPEHRYDPHEIEPRWQELWARERTWEVSNRDPSDARGLAPAPVA